MLMTLLNLVKSSKTIYSSLGILLLVALLYMGWSSLRENIYQEGYQEASQEYQSKIEQQRMSSDKLLKDRLLELETSKERQLQEEIIKVQNESKVDENVKTVTEYIDREVEVPIACDTVPDNLNRLFNESLTRINSPSK